MCISNVIFQIPFSPTKLTLIFDKTVKNFHFILFSWSVFRIFHFYSLNLTFFVSIFPINIRAQLLAEVQKYS